MDQANPVVVDVSDIRHAIYAGSIVYNVGYGQYRTPHRFCHNVALSVCPGFYLLLSVPSIYMLWYQPRTPSRRVLLPYTSCMLVINTACFGFMAIQTDQASQYFKGGPPILEQSKPFGRCGMGRLAMAVFQTLSVLSNDLLFVG